MALLDLLGRRWSLRVLWELRDGEPVTFRELQSRCDSMSPSVLNARLGELREAGIIETQSGGGYALTREGVSLLESLAPLNKWATRWAGSARGPRETKTSR
jgi:DNA-binding HxlR family transcriptional regulator